MSLSFSYRHLYYFWVVAKEGGISRGAERLGMAVQTVSTQVRELERSLGHTLLKPAEGQTKPVLGPRQWKKLQEQITRSEPKPSVKPAGAIKKPYTPPAPTDAQLLAMAIDEPPAQLEKPKPKKKKRKLSYGRFEGY